MKKVVIGVVFQENITTYTYLTHSELDTYLKIFIKFIKNLILLQIYIEFKI